MNKDAFLICSECGDPEIKEDATILCLACTDGMLFGENLVGAQMRTLQKQIENYQQALENIAIWTQDLETYLSLEDYKTMWRGCVAVAKKALKDSGATKSLDKIESSLYGNK